MQLDTVNYIEKGDKIRDQRPVMRRNMILVTTHSVRYPAGHAVTSTEIHASQITCVFDGESKAKPRVASTCASDCHDSLWPGYDLLLDGDAHLLGEVVVFWPLPKHSTHSDFNPSMDVTMDSISQVQHEVQKSTQHCHGLLSPLLIYRPESW